MKSCFAFGVCILLLVLPWQLKAEQRQDLEAGAGQVSARLNLAQAQEQDRDAWLDELSQEFEQEAQQLVADPLQDLNRVVFAFNDALYLHALQPASSAYQFLVPDFMQKGISNFFYNLSYPQRLANNLLQGNLVRAGQESVAFLFNSLVGMGGLLEPAREIPVLQPKPPKQDLGLTLGKWGFGSGIYLVWPVIGPSTVRDSLGMFGDNYLHPLYYIESYQIYLAAKSVEGFNQLPDLLNEYVELKKGALDPYTAVRSGYIQYRQAQMEK